MPDESPLHWLNHISGALARLIVIAGVLPLLPVVLLNQPLAPVLALMGSTFAIEYGAAAVGIGLGLHPGLVLWILLCIAVGVTAFLLAIFEALGEHSERVAAFLARASDRANRSKFIAKYGIYGLVPLVWILGFYVTAPVAWVFGWDRTRSYLLILGGYLVASVVTILICTGLFQLLFP